MLSVDLMLIGPSLDWGLSPRHRGGRILIRQSRSLHKHSDLQGE
jgi:hypothetical protein